MDLFQDLKTLYHVTLAPERGQSHGERLENFYRSQADGYDRFREHLLQGRQELYEQLPTPDGGIWVEMGGGTGANLERLGNRLGRLDRVYLVDLTPSLLRKASERILDRGWQNVQICEADATTFVPEQAADVVTFSYSLTMIPDWFAALENACRILKPGGTLGVVDFYVSRKHPRPPWRRHGWLTRTFWPIWFGSDNVWPSPDHVPYLHRHFTPQAFHEGRTRMKYLLGLPVPYYWFIGTKPTT